MVGTAAGTGTTSRAECRNASGAAETLTEDEQKEVQDLKQRDREVKAHEMAHAAAGGQYAGGASYEYQTGPDGKRYAVGGEVSIDTSPIKGDPEATIRKMQTVRKAALAPAQPSAQDRAVAAKAAQEENKARRQVRKQGTGGPPDEATAADHSPAAKTGGYTKQATAVSYDSSAAHPERATLDLIA
jgi:hypothetical protein